MRTKMLSGIVFKKIIICKYSMRISLRKTIFLLSFFSLHPVLWILYTNCFLMSHYNIRTNCPQHCHSWRRARYYIYRLRAIFFFCVYFFHRNANMFIQLYRVSLLNVVSFFFLFLFVHQYILSLSRY